MTSFRIATLSEVGRVREVNQDALLAEPPLVAVADGMGGHAGGEVASSLALEVLSSWKDRLAERSGAPDVMREAFTEINRAVYERGRSDEALAGMGTTLTAGFIDGDTLRLAHVGDCRAYLLRNGELRQLTRDQNVASEMVRRGQLSEDEAASSPHRHVLLQAIGADIDDLDIETSSVALRPGDRVLLASDGLTGMIADDRRLGELLGSDEDPDVVCRRLVEAANEAGGSDNISVLILEATGEGGGVGDTGELPTLAGTAAASPEPRRRARYRFAVLAGAVLLAAVLVVLFVVRPASTTYIVASRGTEVVVLDGHAGAEDEPAQGRVVRTFDIHVDEFAATVRRDLRMGIPVGSMAEAERVIAGLPRLLGPEDTTVPTPSPSPATSPSPTAVATDAP